MSGGGGRGPGRSRAWAALAAVAMAGVTLAGATLAGFAPGLAPAGAATVPPMVPPDEPAEPADRPGATPAPRRVLVLAVPGLTWSDLAEVETPHLDDLLAPAAIANLSVRVTRLRTVAGEGYATLGTGTRAVAPASVAGLALEPDEAFEHGTAGEVFARRTGTSAAGAAVVHLRLGTVERANEDALFGGEVGALGDALAEAGVARGVVGNSDRARFSGDPEDRHREVALGLMGRDGTVPCGRVGPDLLVDDPGAPFGLRLDEDAVRAAAVACWADGGVVLVEASDLRRAEDYRDQLTRDRRDAARRDAVRAADRLAGALVAELDLRRDAVVVVAPSAPRAGVPRLTAFAVRAPELGPGLLDSATTRQVGTVAIVDVAPTVAELAGAPWATGTSEGRPVRVARDGGTAADRVDVLVRADRAAQFRDRLITPVAVVFILLVVALCGAATWVVARGGPRRALELGSLALIAAFACTYLAGLFPFAEWGVVAYAAFVLGGGATAAALCSLAFGRTWHGPLVGVLTLVVAVPTVSVVLLDGRLQTSTVFGDSPIVAGRFSGINNVTYAAMAAASILVAAVIVHRWPTRRGRVAVVGLLAAVVLVLGAPMWGANIGAILSGVPAFAATAALLAGWRIRPRDVVVWGGATAVVLGTLAGLDLLRDPDSRSHLGRFAERLATDGWETFELTVVRKLDQNLRTLTGSVWRYLVVPVLGLAAVLAWRTPGWLAGLHRRFPPLRPALGGLAVAGVLGYALNDSGIAIPGVMLAVLAPATVHLLVRTETGPGPAPVPAEPPGRGSAGPAPADVQ